MGYYYNTLVYNSIWYPIFSKWTFYPKTCIQIKYALLYCATYVLLVICKLYLGNHFPHSFASAALCLLCFIIFKGNGQYSSTLKSCHEGFIHIHILIGEFNFSINIFNVLPHAARNSFFCSFEEIVPSKNVLFCLVNNRSTV